MNDGDYEIDLIDKTGAITGRKLRKDVVKGVDAYHAVFGVIVNKNKDLVLSLIGNPEGMPNLHAGKIGCSCATIRRSGESADHAMKRAIKKELGLDLEAQKLFELFTDIDNTKRLMTFYILNSEKPSEFNKEDIIDLKEFTEIEFQQFLKENPEKASPPLKLFWSKYIKNLF